MLSSIKGFLYKHPIIVMAVGIIGISVSAIIVRFSSAPSAVTAAYRLFFAVLLMSPIVLCRKGFRAELKKMHKKLLLLSALSGVSLAFHFWTWFESLKRTSVASSTVIVCTEVIWVAIGYRIFLHGTIGKGSILAIVIAFSGSIIIALADFSASGGTLLGDMLALSGALFTAASTLLGRVVRMHTSTTVYTYIVYVFCFITLVLIVAFSGVPFFGYGYKSVLSGLLLAVCSTMMGHTIFSWCLRYFSPAFVSAAKLMEPVIAGIIAAFLFNEIPLWLQIIGDVLVLLGVVLFSFMETGRAGKIYKSV